MIEKLRRREAIYLCLVLCGACTAPRMKESGDEAVPFAWVVSGPEVPVRRRDLESRGATVSGQTRYSSTSPIPADPAFSPLILLTGAIAIKVLFEVVISVYREGKKPGVIIDCRRRPVEIREVPSMLPGTIVLIAPDGKVNRFEPSERTSAAALLEAFGPKSDAK